MINIILVDDEQWALEELREQCGSERVRIAGEFCTGEAALDFVKQKTCRISLAFLDIEMPEMSGIELGEKIREIDPSIAIVYLTAYDNRFRDAFTKVHPEDYLLKPCDRTMIDRAIDRTLAMMTVPLLEVKPFGGFDISAGGQMLDFSSRTKAKELFALCVDALGGDVSVSKAVTSLWPDSDPEDQSKRSYYRSLTVFLKRILEKHGFPDVFISKKGVCRVDLSQIQCEYVDIMNGTRSISETNYNNNYMPEYEWAKNTNELLQEKRKRESQ